MDRERPLMLTVMLFGSDIIILIFSNFSKNPYYSYVWETRLFQKIKTRKKSCSWWRIQMKLHSRVPSTELPSNSLAFIASSELIPLGHSPFLLHLRLCHSTFPKSSFHYLKPKVISTASQPCSPALTTHLSKRLDQW